MDPTTRRILLTIFFLSGFAALLYQVVWQRMLIFYTGSDTVSISLIVTAFMTGLGIGYLAGGRLADRSTPQRNLLLFVLAEVGILLFATFSKAILYDWLYVSGPNADGNALVLYLMVFLVLLVPTFLMGVSLPLLSKAFRLSGEGEQAGLISSLYFVNTLGAAFGALLSGVVFVRSIGYADTIWAGVVCNAICAVGALLLRGKVSVPSSSTAPVAPVTELRPLVWTPRLYAWMLQYGLSGFAALSLELIWFRVLETLIKSVSITFSLLLAVYLGSMAIGTKMGERWAKNRPAPERERAFLWSQAVLYAYVGLSFLTFIGAIFNVGGLQRLWDYFKSYEPDLSLHIILPTYLLIPLFLMFIPTFLMGLSFSISQSLIQDKFEEVGRKVGALQFVNILGSALGAWCVTWIGFNYLGSGVMVKLLAALALLYLIVLLVRKHVRRGVFAAGVLCLVAVVSLLPWNTDFWRRLNGIIEPDRFLFDENESGLSIVKRYEKRGELIGVVFANGLGQSSMPYRQDPIHIELGVIPVLLHPKPVDVAVIGLGSGGTLYGTAARSETQRLVCFEIMSNQRGVLAGYADRFNDGALDRILNDSRVDLVPHDGRYKLTVSPEKFDVIEADALRPNSAFSGNIYSKEYFTLLRERLKPGGMAVTWCPTPRVLATMREVFPYLTQVEGFLVMGSNEPILIDDALIQQRASDPFTQDHFKQAGIDIDAIAAAYKGRIQPVEPGPSPVDQVNTDLFPRDEFSLPYPWEYLRKKLGM